MKKRDAVHLISRQGFKKKNVISVQKQQQLKGDLLRMGLLRAGEREIWGRRKALAGFRRRLICGCYLLCDLKEKQL